MAEGSSFEDANYFWNAVCYASKDLKWEIPLKYQKRGY